MTQKPQKEWRRLMQLYAKRVIVDGLNADVLTFDRDKLFALERGL